MDVILKDDVKNLGAKDSLVKVRPGYARNFLLPKGLAVQANESSKKHLEETNKQRAYKLAKERNAAQFIADQLKDKVITIGAKVGETGKIFGSVTPLQISDALKKRGFDIDRRQISIEEDHIKTLGTYTADVVVNKDVKFVLNFEVVEE